MKEVEDEEEAEEETVEEENEDEAEATSTISRAYAIPPFLPFLYTRGGWGVQVRVELTGIPAASLQSAVGSNANAP